MGGGQCGILYYIRYTIEIQQGDKFCDKSLLATRKIWFADRRCRRRRLSTSFTNLLFIAVYRLFLLLLNVSPKSGLKVSKEYSSL